MNILLVEDDLELGRALHAVLQADGFAPVWVRMAGDALCQLERHPFAALVLDLGLPDGDGMALLRRLRAEGRDAALPIVLITARHGLDDRLSGFAEGADDYMVKPFDMEELLARLRAVLRRSRRDAGGVLACGALVLDERRIAVHRDGRALALSRTEFNLLLALMRESGRVVTRGELEDSALAGSESLTLDVHMSNLRKKIGEQRVRTVRGVGYMIVP